MTTMRLFLLTSCVLFLCSSASAQVRDQGIRDQGIRDQGIRDQGIRDQGIRDQGIRDQGIRDQGIRDQGPSLPQPPPKVMPSPQGPTAQAPIVQAQGFYLQVTPGTYPPEFPGYAHVQVVTPCYSQTVYTHRPRCCLFNFRRSSFGGRCW